MILGEALHGSQAVGGAAVLAGVYWTTRAAYGGAARSGARGPIRARRG
jgi:drug/metabolite transporter (DMT)-like permease